MDLKNKKVIIFDLDGTIVDSVGVWTNVDKELIKMLGKEPTDDIGKFRAEILHKYNQGNIYLNYIEHLKEKYQFSQSSEEILELRLKIAHDYIINTVKLKPYVDTLLLKLKEKGYDIALASTTSKWCVDIYFYENKNITSKIDLEKIFKYIVTKDDVSNKKPDPEAFLKCANYFNVKPTDCLVIEDSLIGVTAAKNANMNVICIYDENSEFDLENLKNLADIFIDDFNELINLID